MHGSWAGFSNALVGYSLALSSSWIFWGVTELRDETRACRDTIERIHRKSPGIFCVLRFASNISFLLLPFSLAARVGPVLQNLMVELMTAVAPIAFSDVMSCSCVMSLGRRGQRRRGRGTYSLHVSCPCSPRRPDSRPGAWTALTQHSLTTSLSPYPTSHILYIYLFPTHSIRTSWQIYKTQLARSTLALLDTRFRRLERAGFKAITVLIVRWARLVPPSMSLGLGLHI